MSSELIGKMKLRRLIATATASAAFLAIGACSSPSEPANDSLPGGAVHSDQIKLAAIEPDDGTAPVVNFIGSAKKSLDIVMYEFNPDVTAITTAIKQAQSRGVVVRVLLSRQVYPDGPDNHNVRDRKTLLAMGINVQLSRPEFSYSHQKSYLIDAGTKDAKVFISDFNIGPSYMAFVPDPSGKFPKEAGTRGIGIIDTDPEDVAEVAAVFEADWPPYKAWPAYTRPNLVWAPGDPKFVPTGNSITALQSLISSAKVTLDIYAQELALPSILFQPLLERAQAGIKVRIVGNLGGVNDDAVSQLTQAGVQIVQSPTMKQYPGKYLYVHTKTIIVDHNTDRAVAFVGSENPFLDESIQTERELGGFVTETDSVRRINDLFERDFASSAPYPVKPGS